MNHCIIDVAIIEEWITEDLSTKAVELTLITKGYESTIAKQYLSEFKRLKRAKHYSFGLMFLAFCIQTGLIACFVAMHKF